MVHEDTSQVDISLPSRSGRIVGTSADDEPKTGSEHAQRVTIDAQSQSVSSQCELYDNLIGSCS